MALFIKRWIVVVLLALMLPACTITTAGGTSYTVRGPQYSGQNGRPVICDIDIDFGNASNSEGRVRVVAKYGNSGRVQQGNSTEWQAVSARGRTYVDSVRLSETLDYYVQFQTKGRLGLGGNITELPISVRDCREHANDPGKQDLLRLTGYDGRRSPYIRRS